MKNAGSILLVNIIEGFSKNKKTDSIFFKIDMSKTQTYGMITNVTTVKNNPANDTPHPIHVTISKANDVSPD